MGRMGITMIILREDVGMDCTRVTGILGTSGMV